MKLATRLLVVALLMAACGDDDEDIDVIIPEDDGGVVVGAKTFNVPLTFAEEVPVCAAYGTSATGNATISVSADNSTITVSNFTWSGLSGPATAAHIHPGATGVAGPIVLPFGDNPTAPINTTFTAADFPSPVPANSPADFAAFVDAMRAGDTYINVHTAACPSGEIRGQID